MRVEPRLPNKATQHNGLMNPMPNERTLVFEILTPAETIFQANIDSLRVPTFSGHVGLRPRGEPTVIPVEAGLVIIHHAGETTYAGTTGGVLRCDGQQARLLTPLAVVGSELAQVSEQLQHQLDAPGEEIETRRTLGKLETRIVRELHQTDDGRTSLRRDR